MERIVLAYSGGLDTSVAIPWLTETLGAEVIAVTLDLGQGSELNQVRERALAAGAVRAHVLDVCDTFARGFVLPALQAGALYEGQYPLAAALARPLMAQTLVDLAAMEGATAIAHGSTGKGNGQARLDLARARARPVAALLAPAREWSMTRAQEIAYAAARGIPVAPTLEHPYSTDANLWGRSVSCGVLEDPWAEPPEDVFTLTRPRRARTGRSRVRRARRSRRACRSALNGVPMPLVELIATVATIAGHHGVGRIDMVENRLLGIKSREIHEAPAAVVLHAAHRDLQAFVTTRELDRIARHLGAAYADLVYNGLWFTDARRAMDAFVAAVQQRVTGDVRAQAVPRRLPGRRPPVAVRRLRSGPAPTATATARSLPPRASDLGLLEHPPDAPLPVTRTVDATDGASLVRPLRRRTRRRSSSSSARRSGSIAACSKTTSPAAWRGPRRCARRRAVGRRRRRHRRGARRHLERGRRRSRRSSTRRRTRTCTRLSSASSSTRIGDAGRRLHTGRSRNEQVSLDLRLYLRRRMAVLQRAFARSIARARGSGRAAGDALMPSYTHLRRAQPVLVAHFLLAHAAALRRDHARLAAAAARGRRAAARFRRRCRHELRHRHRRARRRASASRASSPTASMPRRTATSSSSLPSRLRAGDGPPEPACGGHHHLQRRGIRVLRAVGRGRDRQQHDAAEEEPRSARARARQGGPRHRPPRRAGWRR